MDVRRQPAGKHNVAVIKHETVHSNFLHITHHADVKDFYSIPSKNKKQDKSKREN
jgi:hypothetical protein